MSDAAAAAAEAVTKAGKGAAEGAGATVTKLKKSGLSASGTVLGVLGGLAVGGLLAAGGLLLWKHREKVFDALRPASSGDQPATKPATVTKFKAV